MEARTSTPRILRRLSDMAIMPRVACSRTPAPKLRLVPLSTIAPRDVSWLWRGYIPARVLTIMEGDGGGGKSSVLRGVASVLTTGGTLPGDEPQPRPRGVIWLSTEEDAATDIRPALEANGCDLSRVFVMAVDDLWSPDMVAEIGAYVTAHDVAMVVLDQGKDYLGLPDEDEMRVRKALLPWRRAAQASEAACVFIRHWKKGAGSAAERGSGTVAYRNVARQTLVVGKIDGDARVMAPEKRYRGGVDAPSLTFVIGPTGAVEWTGTTDLTADDLALYQPQPHSDQGKRQAPKRDACGARMRELLSSVPTLASDVRAILQAEGYSTQTINEARKALGVVSTGATSATMWSLPEGRPS